MLTAHAAEEDRSVRCTMNTSLCYQSDPLPFHEHIHAVSTAACAVKCALSAPPHRKHAPLSAL